MPALLSSDRMVLTRLARRERLPVLSGMALRLAWVLLLWSHRRSSRKRLARLDPHLLRDIGISPDDALFEARKPFWRP